MNRIWNFALGGFYDFTSEELIANKAFHNWEAMFEGRSGIFDSWKAATPPADITISLDGYAPDLMHIEGILFASKRLRSSIDQPAHVVEYLDVLPDKLAPSARAADYKMIHILASESAIDVEQSTFEMKSWRVNDPQPQFAKIVMKKSLIPKTEMFRDRFGITYEFCTDALAMRVLRSGCTGIRFFDPASLHQGNTVRWRTLRGVEMKIWNPDLDDFVTTLVEEIPLVH